MYAPERQQLLAERLQLDGRLVVIDIAEELTVSTETIRRDLAVLERDGLAKRVHGGAVATRAMRIVEPGLAQRTLTNAEQKDRIAKAAVEFIPAEGGSITLDAGTTTSRFVDEIPLDHALTVITHAIPIAAKLTAVPSVTLHMLGGRVRGVTAAAVGQQMTESLVGTHVDVCFLGSNAIDARLGLSTPDADEAAAKRALAGCAATVVVLVDASKFAERHVFTFATYDDIDVVITDDGVSPADVAALEEHDVKVVIA